MRPTPARIDGPDGEIVRQDQPKTEEFDKQDHKRFGFSLGSVIDASKQRLIESGFDSWVLVGLEGRSLSF